MTSPESESTVDSVRGLSFPFRVDPRTGGLATSAGPDKLRENVVHLLLTRVGERVMLREYGGNVTQLLQNNVDDGLLAIAQHQITKALLKFEPRILPQQVTLAEGEQGQLLLRVQYLDASRNARQAVIPID